MPNRPIRTGATAGEIIPADIAEKRIGELLGSILSGWQRVSWGFLNAENTRLMQPLE
jgi:hypothetical protein